MKKRIIGFALVLCLLLTLAPAAAFAEEPAAEEEITAEGEVSSVSDSAAYLTTGWKKIDGKWY